MNPMNSISIYFNTNKQANVIYWGQNHGDPSDSFLLSKFRVKLKVADLAV